MEKLFISHGHKTTPSCATCARPSPITDKMNGSIHGSCAGRSGLERDPVREAATLQLALPWELLHDGNDYLFQGANPVRVRRRLPNTRVLDVPVVATPIRILLITARPEDESCAYIDDRASALPLVEAMESLPGLVKIHILSPPTLAALRVELD